MAGPMKKVTPWSPAGNNTGDAKQISCHSHHEFKGFKGYSSENTTRWKRSLCAHGSLTDWRDNLLLTDCVRPSIQGAEPACWCRGSIPQTVETASFPKSATLTISHDLPTAVPQHNLKSLHPQSRHRMQQQPSDKITDYQRAETQHRINTADLKLHTGSRGIKSNLETSAARLTRPRYDLDLLGWLRAPLVSCCANCRCWIEFRLREEQRVNSSTNLAEERWKQRIAFFRSARDNKGGKTWTAPFTRSLKQRLEWASWWLSSLKRVPWKQHPWVKSSLRPLLHASPPFSFSLNPPSQRL